MHEGFGKQKQPMFRMLWGGLILLMVCLGLCIYQVSILQKTYRDEVSDDFNTHNEIAADAVAYWIEDIISAVEKKAAEIEMSDDSDESIKQAVYSLMYSEDGIYAIFENADKNYIYDTTMVDENVFNDMSATIEASTVGVEKNYVGFLCNSEGVWNLYIMAPVTIDDSLKGRICAMVDINKMFEMTTFDYQKRNGNMYLTGSDMGIKYSCQKELIYYDDGEDFASALISFSDGTDNSKKAILRIKTNMVKKLNGSEIITDKNGESVQISYHVIKNTDNMYFISCFTNNLVDDKVQPLIYRNVFTCICIIAMMIGVILYVWASAKKAGSTIEKMAYEDITTGGKNINYFHEFANSVMSVFKETPFVIYRFDIANFRYLNEAYGHFKADAILQSCIANFSHIFSEKELCVRMNADQFLAIIVNDHNLDQNIAEFIKRVNEDARAKGVKYPIKFKTGIYQIKKHDHDLDVMIDHANAARKMVHSNDKHMTAIYTDEIVNQMRKVDKIESDMQKALATGEFKVYYQAKWDIVADHVAGAEALVRWIKNDGGMVYPDEFIPIFEKNGFIEKLDFYVLETVCEDLRKMLDDGKTVYPVSVNQSRLLLHSPDYVENIKKILEKYDMPEGAIELEITETVFDDDRDRMIETLNELKKFGVKISMDDFGSGYSSLNMLKDAPFDIIKIDREFFSESVTSDISMWILQKIIEMVSGLGMEVICEGVETGEQSALLKALGCRMVQGYFYSRPVPHAEYVDRFCS